MSSFLGLGAMPGTDPVESADIILGESMDGRVHVPVLPARGLGADVVGRTGAMLPELTLDRGPRSWRVVDNPSRATWRARDFLDRDLDACEEVWGSSVRRVRLPIIGPWSLAASVELGNGHLMLSDRGAVRFLAQSLAEGLVQQARDVQQRTGASVEVLIDEPLLPDVALGRVAAPSSALGDVGYLPAQGWREIATLLREVTGELRSELVTVESSGQQDTAQQGSSQPSIVLRLPTVTGLHYGLVSESGVTGVWLPRSGLKTTEQLDFAGALIGAGLKLELGLVSAAHITRAEHSGVAIGPEPRAIAENAALLWDELGFSRADFASQLDLAPTSSLAATKADEPVAVLSSGREAAELINRAAGDLARDQLR